jgi:hypothetical protein
MINYFIKYKCDITDNIKYNNTIELMKNIYDDVFVINEWYIADNIGILIISCNNFFCTKIKLQKYINIIEYKQIYSINNWLNNYENNYENN